MVTLASLVILLRLIVPPSGVGPEKFGALAPIFVEIKISKDFFKYFF